MKIKVTAYKEGILERNNMNQIKLKVDDFIEVNKQHGNNLVSIKILSYKQYSKYFKVVYEFDYSNVGAVSFFFGILPNRLMLCEIKRGVKVE